MVSLKTAWPLRLAAASLLILCAMVVTGCDKAKDASFIGTFRMGERVQIGSIVYQILEADWRSELGEGGRNPRDRYLFLKVSIVNGSGSTVSVPGFTLEGGGKTYGEVTEQMEKVSDWLGLFRNIAASQTQQGWVVFDAPMAAYKLVVTDGGDIASEKFAHVDIPVHLE